MKTDFISIADHSRDWIEEIFETTEDIKKKQKNGEAYQPLMGKSLAMVFQKPSARTRTSFEIGMWQLGGYAVYLAPADIQMGKREATKDIAQLFSRYNDGIMARLFEHIDMIKLAQYSTIPVINGLTDLLHPCQIMADLYTIREHLGRIIDFKIVFIGDGNNVANSWINIAGNIPFHFVLSCPEGYEPNREVLNAALSENVGEIEIIHDPYEAVRNADVIYTDTWTSMGQEEEQEKRKKDFLKYQVNDQLISLTKSECKFMHCLPAHRGDEVTDEIIDGPRSIVFDEAENRLHVQKAIMVKLMT